MKLKAENTIGVFMRTKWLSEILISPILEESAKNKDSIKIRGTAIKARTSRNGVTYPMHELAKAHRTLQGKSIGLDHSESVADNVGVIDRAFTTGDGIDYEGTIHNTGKHPYLIDMLKNGLIRHVSIEAVTPTLSKDQVATNLEFLGLSLVRHPGIPEASVELAESFRQEVVTPSPFCQERLVIEKSGAVWSERPSYIPTHLLEQGPGPSGKLVRERSGAFYAENASEWY